MEETDETLDGVPGGIAAAVGRILLLFLLFFLAAASAANMLRIHRKKRKYFLSDGAGKLAYLMCYELSLLAALGFKRMPEETLLQYERRLLSGGQGLPPGFSGFVGVYMESFYGGRAYGAAKADIEGAVLVVKQTELMFQGVRRLYVLYLRFTFSENML